MAMRPRGGGAVNSRRATRSGLVRPVYEDFRPVSEWLQDDETHILNIYLPGFMKEQIRVTTQGRNTIRVRGERLVAGNKWSRFLEDFQVPENGEMNSVRAKFQGGILSMTVPKEKVSKAVPPEAKGFADIRKQPKDQVKAIPDVKAIGGTEPQNLPGDLETRRGQDGKNHKQPIPQKGHSAEDKSLEPRKASAEPSNKHDLGDDQIGRSVTPLKKKSNNKESVEPKNAHDPDGDQGGRSFTPMKTTGHVLPQNDGKKESETKEKLVAPEKPDGETEERAHKEGKETMNSSELPEAETTRTKKLEKHGATCISEKKTGELYGASKKQKRNRAMKGLTELNEQRQLLVNMGVAMLVIMALTAYVTYNFASATARDKH